MERYERGVGHGYIGLRGENLMGRRGDREMGRLLNFGMRMAEWRIKD